MINRFNLAIAFIAMASFTACKSNSSDDESSTEVKNIPVINVFPTDTIIPVVYVADIHSVKNVEIHPRIAGILEKIYISEGQQVTAGQIMFKINDSELQIELNRATAAYNSVLAEMKVAEVERGRVEALVGKKVIPHSELELIQAKYNAANAKVQQALAEKNAVAKRISYTEIRAPFSGIVDRFQFREGSLVNEMSLLTTVSDNSSMYAYFNVSEKIYFDMMNNGGEDEVEKVRLVLPNGEPYKHHGVIKPAESEIDGTTGSIAYKVAFANPNYLLRHGASGKLILDQPVRGAFLIPQKSVWEIQDKYYVFVVDKNNKVKTRVVHPFNRVANYFIITSGLSEGEQIVFEGVKLLRDGDEIQPQLQKIN